MFSDLLIKKTCNIGLMKNNGEAHLFLQELLEWHVEIHFIFFEQHLHFLSMQYLLQWQLTNPCLFPDVIEADRRDSELEGTSCASIKVLSAVVNSLWAYSCSSRPFSCPTDKSQKSWHQRRLLGHFWGARRPRSRSGTLTKTSVPISTAESLELERETIFWACCSWPDFAPSCSMLIQFFLTQTLQVTFSPKPSLSSL